VESAVTVCFNRSGEQAPFADSRLKCHGTDIATIYRY
jgi:hypothetical protein